MSAPLRHEILKLYKDLLRYGQQLKYTDKSYYNKRIKKEFSNNKTLNDIVDINYNYKLRHMQNRLCYNISIRQKSAINYSNVPKLEDSDLEEQFVRGSGPGGQSVNKTANKVVLKHKPTGLVIQCHESRSLDQNRKEARSLLITKLDNLINKENSVENQIKRIESKKIAEKNRRRNKLKDLKEEWKKREKLI